MCAYCPTLPPPDLVVLRLTREIMSRVRNPVYPLDVVDKLLEDTMPSIDKWLSAKAAAGKNNNCTLENAVVRREWFVFSLYNALRGLRASPVLTQLTGAISLSRRGRNMSPRCSA